ncbi:type VII secretion target [Micromonospora sp. LOL_023]|uniref:type VII secretion target n=1 Tax=Micromonospora sp. LOL_023 TaxID=3345418 RepID=UPI003A8BAC86
MDDTEAFAAELTRCADRLAGTARDVAGFAEADWALGADQPGRLGALAGALGQQWRAALADRAAEATDAGQRLSDVATGLRSAVSAYRDSDDAARRHQPEGA